LALALSPAFGLARFWPLALSPIDLLVSVLAYGAMMRIALADIHPGEAAYAPGPGGLQWTRIETRLLAALLLIGLFVGLAALGAVFLTLLTAIIVAAVSGLAARSSGGFLDSPSGIAASAVFLVAMCVLLWACVRLVLSTAATVDRQQVQVFSTWKLTRGAAPPLFVALFIIAAPAVVLNAVGRLAAGSLAGPGVWVAYGLVVGFVQTPLTAGVCAYAYLKLTGTVHPTETLN